MMTPAGAAWTGPGKHAANLRRGLAKSGRRRQKDKTLKESQGQGLEDYHDPQIELGTCLIWTSKSHTHANIPHLLLLKA